VSNTACQAARVGSSATPQSQPQVDVVQRKRQRHAQPAHARRHLRRAAGGRERVAEAVVERAFQAVGHASPASYIYVDVNVSLTMPDLPRSAAAPTYTITELAQEFDVTPRAIRFYEDVGLLTPARSGRNRVYTQRDRTRLKLTLRGKRLGLSLQEIKQLVDMYDSPSDTAQQLQAFLGVLGEHRRLLEQQREDIEITLAEIAQHEARCRSLLAPKSRRRSVSL
jgi:DNA-binding transcriptional MerR regulator